MKFLFLIVAILLAPLAMADAVKSLEGKIIYCSLEEDINGTGYRPSAISLQGDGDTLSLSLKAESLVCRKRGDSLGWETRNFHDPVPSTDLFGNPITLLPTHQEFTLANSQNDTLGSIAAINGPKQELAYNFDLESILSKENVEILERGGKVEVHWDFSLRGFFQMQRGSERVNVGQFSGGAYLLSFQLRKRNGRIVAIREEE